MAENWWDAFPKPQAPPLTVTVLQVAEWMSDPAKQQGVDFLVVDTRRNDHEGGHVRNSENLAAQTFYNVLPEFGNRVKNIPYVIFYCSSSKGRGPRCAGWYQDWLDTQNITTSRACVMEGGIKAWLLLYARNPLLTEDWLSPEEEPSSSSPILLSVLPNNSERNQAPDNNNTSSVLKSLSFVDRYLFVWIISAMLLGIVLGEFTDIAARLSTATLDTVAIPIALGLIVMMVPPLCKVQWEQFPLLVRKREVWHNVGISLFLNWVVGPLVMFAIAWATLPDLPGYRTGVIMVGLARCIAMVMIWNQIACGDMELCAILVIINSVLQIVLYAPLALLFINVISGSHDLHLSYSQVARAVGIYLGIPLGIGFLIRFGCLLTIGREVYTKRVLPYISPFSLLGLLYTILILFANQSRHILHNLGPVFRTFVPLMAYFLLIWFSTFWFVRWVQDRGGNRNEKLSVASTEEGGYTSIKKSGACYRTVIPQTFTAASNNFELSIAVATGVYGVQSEQALAATIGPLIEVPVLVCLSYLALHLRTKLRWEDVEEKEKKEKTTTSPES